MENLALLFEHINADDETAALQVLEKNFKTITAQDKTDLMNALCLAVILC